MRGTAVPKFPSTDDAQAKKAKEHKDKLISFDKTRYGAVFTFWVILLNSSNRLAAKLWYNKAYAN